MADLPISFSGPMVRALIAGTKTQTRRIISPQPEAGVRFAGFERDGQALFTKGCFYGKWRPRYLKGDRLYVREHWRTIGWWEQTPPRDIPKGASIFYEAGPHPSEKPIAGKFRQAMHMPKWASRITLIVEGVKVERLQDISGDDAIAEGLHEKPWASERAVKMGCNWGYDGNDMYGSPVSAYAFLWNEINGIGAWDANPWVVAYTFRRIMGNIDQNGGGE